MTSTPVEVGTLIVVILKAKNLPNKRHIGKQDPYCLVKLNKENRRTKAVKRGGQHPEWDEEVRFTILEDVEDELARTAGKDGTHSSPPPPPPKKEEEKGKETEKKKKKIKGPKQMQLMCYADDPREPALIGETMVDLTEVLTKGETDEWFTLTNKEKYCGEVYLELTFWSNEKPPEKRTTPPSSTFHPQYGGPGSFTPSAELPSSLRHGGSSHNTPSPSRLPSSSGPDPPVPPSLRPSGSLAQISLYTAPYERRNRYDEVDKLSNDLADLGVSSPTRRRESFPPVQAGPSEFGYTGGNAHQNGSYSTISTSASVSSVHSLGPHVSGSRPPQAHSRPSLSSLPEPFAQDEYFSGLPRTMQPVSESYPPRSPYQYQPSSGFVQPPPLSQTPVPVPPQFPVPSSGPTTMSSTAFVSPPPPSAMGFHSPPPPQQYPAPPQTPVQYPTYSQPPVSAPPLQYVPEDAPLPPASVSPNSHPSPQQYRQHPTPSPPQHHQLPPPPNAYQQYGHQATPPQQHQQPLPPANAYQQYGQHATPSPPHQHQQPPPPPNVYQQMQPGVPLPQGSRPLPNPQVQQYHPRQENLSSSGFTSPPPGTPSSISSGNMTFPNAMPFQPPGPPPPRRRASLPPSPTKTPSIAYPLPPPPPPPLQNGVYQPHASHQNTPPPPPPPPPPSLYQSNSSLSQPYPSQQSQQPYPSQQVQQPYPSQQAQQPYPPQQSQSYGSWAPPPPPLPLVSGFSSPPHPSSFSTPPSHQPYYANDLSGVPGWNTPPRQNPSQYGYESQDGRR